MRLLSNSLTDGKAVPAPFAFAVPDPESHVALSSNQNPHLVWSDVPMGTKSFVIICHDPDVPSVGDDVNQQGKTVPADLPRIDFYHWLLWNIPADLVEIAAASQADGVTAKGKPGPTSPLGWNHGINSYTDWFAGDADMEGLYYGYDGPCPPWNDSIVHHYIFTVYALDTEQLDLGEGVTGPQLLQAIEGHILDKASLTGTYSLNPDVAF